MATPLGLAIRYDHIDAIRLLLKHGANPICELCGINVYHVLSSNSADILALLISYGMPSERNLPIGMINIDDKIIELCRYAGLKVIYTIYA